MVRSTKVEMKRRGVGRIRSAAESSAESQAFAQAELEQLRLELALREPYALVHEKLPQAHPILDALRVSVAAPHCRSGPR